MEPAAVRRGRQRLADRPRPRKADRRTPREWRHCGLRAGPQRPRPFLQRAADPAPADAEECETHTIAGDDAIRLPRLLALLAEHGPLPVPEEAVDLFRWRTGVPRPTAALVLDGFPGRDDYDEHRKLLRAKPYKADRAAVHAYGEFRGGSAQSAGAPCSRRPCPPTRPNCGRRGA